MDGYLRHEGLLAACQKYSLQNITSSLPLHSRIPVKMLPMLHNFEIQPSTSG